MNCVCVVVCALVFSSPFCKAWTSLWFYTWSKVLVLVLHCVVMGGLGEGPVWYKKGPCPLSLFVVTGIDGEWGDGGSGRGQVNVLLQIIVWNQRVLKSLVLLCERTSPPGAHKVYVQNNKW